MSFKYQLNIFLNTVEKLKNYIAPSFKKFLYLVGGNHYNIHNYNIKILNLNR